MKRLKLLVLLLMIMSIGACLTSWTLAVALEESQDEMERLNYLANVQAHRAYLERTNAAVLRDQTNHRKYGLIEATSP